ncbi:JAB domain-containing protein [Methylocystis parvus]|uniref:JAB domain-containing protein n=1 Tax=Methylocystis parvus TaxID=134 RepID=UPI003C71B371
MAKTKRIEAASSPLDDPDTRVEALEFAVQASKCGLWAWDFDSDALAWSPEAAAMLGVESIEPTIEGFLRLVHPGDVDKGRAAFTRALAAGSTLYLEFRRTCADGGASWFAAFGKPHYDGGGVARCFVGAISPLPARAAREDFSRLAEDPRFVTRDLALARLARLREDVAACLAGTDDIRRAAVEEDILQFLLCRIVMPDVAARDAAALMARFGSLSTMFLSPQVAATVEGVDERHLMLFETVRLSIQCALRPTREPVQFTSESAIVSYLRVAQAYKTREQLRVIFLDRSRHIICDEVMQEGTVDHAPVYVREIMKRALELSASSIILAHNHPSGNAMPSFQDILKTQQIVEAARTLGITVDDHIILTRHGHTSMRALKMMDGSEGE